MRRHNFLSGGKSQISSSLPFSDSMMIYNTYDEIQHIVIKSKNLSRDNLICNLITSVDL
jgi:hypothetical protein